MIYNCDYKILNQKYNLVLDCVKNYCTKFLFVVRNDFKNTDNINEVINIFNDDLDEISESNIWPGTILLDDVAAIYKYSFTEKSLLKLQSISNSFDNWRYPIFPEDLCFISQIGVEFLVTITHEHDAYFDLNDIEFEKINKIVPNLLIKDN
jgi:hypothetical protein